MKKSEYAKHLKRLIKKYHPDLCNDGYIQSVYNEITVKLVNELNKIKNDSGYGLIKPENQDYFHYKTGINYYRNIHPNQFYKRNADTTFETKTYDELVSALNKIYLSFNLSEFYFKKVIKEYPQSPYYEDAKTKIQLLKKLHKCYENPVLEENKIIDSEKFISEMGLRMM